MRIRFATPDDAELIFGFIEGLAEHVQARDQVQVTPAQLRGQLAAPHPPFECLIGEVDQTPWGFALFYQTYSTWTGKPGLWLEDLYVLPAARGQGFGKALLAQLAALTCSRGYARLEWSVVAHNHKAFAFYKNLGAQALPDWTIHRVTGHGLQTLAAQAPETAVR